MQVRYEFVTGEVVEVEVSQAVWCVSEEIKDAQASRDRMETRDHTLQSTLNVEGSWFAERVSIPSVDRSKMVQDALRRMPPSQRALLMALYAHDKPISYAQYASSCGLSEEVIKQRVKRARRTFVKLMQKTDTFGQIRGLKWRD